MELISVVVPVYNVEKYLERCMESIQNQTYSELEIILVDDGSTDGSGTMCDAYAREDERITVIHKKNGGLSSARNAGIEQAHGTYIGFVDSDDWIAPDMYENLKKLLDMYECDIAVCGIKRTQKYIKPDREIFDFSRAATFTSKEYQKKILKVGTQDSNHYAVNKLYKLEKMKDVRYPVGLIDEDVEGTFLAVLMADKIAVSDSVGYYYWINPNSITTQLFDQKQLDFLTICDRVYKISQERCDAEIQRDAELFRYRADLAMLSRMAISDIAPDYKEAAIQDAEKMAADLRKHRCVLRKAKMPLNRKVLMTLFCINEKITFQMIRCVRKVINQRRKSVA